MRRYIKKELNKSVNYLFDTTSLLPERFQSGGASEYIQLLQNMQNQAINAGNLIELSEGENHPAVHRLENICELIYQCSIADNPATVSAAGADIRTAATELRGAIKSFSEDKLIAVFLPYKASMWDSLESVWMAARDDEECTSYVIPIPYYDKDKDGRLTTMHYDGQLYPDYVPVTDWKSISLEKLHPDIIYYHNPYDNTNKVTSVHPDYYSSKLRQYGARLVYIPYFVNVDEAPAHLCTTPGVLYADVVVVENEKVKQSYIKAIKSIEQETGHQGIFGELDTKILPLGSPKYDKLSDTVNSEAEIPPDWRPLIYNEDGTRKKILFYNTSISYIMEYGQKMIDKISDTIHTIAAMKDCVLLWRPHPLMLDTIRSMCPELEQQYSDIVREFKEKKLGIYDDTSDMSVAIAISDAYYGDGGSSVVAVYEKTGKPVMVQNVDVRYTD